MVAREQQASAAGGERLSYAIPLVDGTVQALIAAAEGDTFDAGFGPAYLPGYILVINLVPEGEGARQGLRNYDHIVAIDGQRIPILDPDEMVARRIYLHFLRRPPGAEVALLISRANADEDGVGRRELVIGFVVPQRSRVP